MLHSFKWIGLDDVTAGEDETLPGDCGNQQGTIDATITRIDFFLFWVSQRENEDLHRPGRWVWHPRRKRRPFAVRYSNCIPFLRARRFSSGPRTVRLRQRSTHNSHTRPTAKKKSWRTTKATGKQRTQTVTGADLDALTVFATRRTGLAWPPGRPRKQPMAHF